jgi:hypothetical protein
MGRPDSQLVLFHSVGGAHPAPSLRVYDLESPPRLLFDSDAYSYQDAHADQGWSDLDGDGLPEVVIHTSAFAYMYDTPYSASPFPPLIFKYDAKSRRYRLANWSFDKLLLRTTKESTKDSENASFSFNKVLTYIYTGHADEAWKMFDRLYPNRDKETMASEIRKVLAQDPAYRELYERR